MRTICYKLHFCIGTVLRTATQPCRGGAGSTSIAGWCSWALLSRSDPRTLALDAWFHPNTRSFSLSAHLAAIEEPGYVEALAAGVLRCERRSIAQAITLCESVHPKHSEAAAALLTRLLQARPSASTTPIAGAASVNGLRQRDGPPLQQPLRIAVSGPPGSGKSSLIEALGCRLVDGGHKVAVSRQQAFHVVAACLC